MMVLDTNVSKLWRKRTHYNAIAIKQKTTVEFLLPFFEFVSLKQLQLHGLFLSFFFLYLSFP